MRVVREERSGRWLLVLAGSCATFSVVFGVVAWLIFRDRPGWTSSDVLAAVGIAAGLGGVVGALFGQPLFGQWLAERRAQPASAVPEALEDADRLAEAVKDQWTRAAAERRLLAPSSIPVQWKVSSLPVTGPLSAAVGTKDVPARFEPLPGLGASTEVELLSGRRRELHAVYGGLASGRLVIVGQPGSGKTGAAVLLVLDALAHRERVRAEDRALVPVPVLLTLQGWDPGRERFDSWLVVRLAETYPLFAGRRGAVKARALLSAGKLAVILDGLDEIPETLRAAALRALSEQAVFRAVILTRSAEMVAAASEAHLADAVALELQDVDARVAADYLTRVHVDPAPAGWRELIDCLREAPASAIARAMGTPLTLTLVRDTYRAADDVRELFDVASRAANADTAQAAIENHLLDRILPAAYAPRLGEPAAPYDLLRAERALRYIATRMNQDQTRDLGWWHVASWAPLAPRVIVSGLIGGLILALGGWLAGGLPTGLVLGVFGLLGGFASGSGGEQPQQAALRVRQMFRGAALAEALKYGLAVGLLSVVVVGLAGGLKVGLGAGLAGGLAGGLAAWILAGVSESIPETTSPLSPLACWRADRRSGRVSGLVIGFGLSVVGVVGVGLVPGVVLGVTTGLAVALMGSQTWAVRLAFLQLAGERQTPARLIGFLEDARGRGVLRTVGPVYQFRHARLQDRLDEHQPTPWSGPS